MAKFDYKEAFSRNIGWVTDAEQEILRAKRIAIAGLGGVGGSHLLTLTRLGIGGFHISDLDVFELANFNRQAGASLRHIDRPKCEVMAELAADINSEMYMKTFPNGINEENVDEFLDGIDLYVDGLDFFALKARKTVFNACAEKGIPAVTAAPLGMGTAVLNFLPGGMTVEEYFRFEGHDENEQALRFMLGMSPALLQMGYLVDETKVDFDAKKGPSTPMACEMCTGVAATQALKILLNRGKVIAAPRGLHFDAYRNKFTTTWRPWGNNNPIQQIGLMIARRVVSPNSAAATAVAEVADTAIHRILDYSRWAPSGDNEQPWRFQVVDDRNFVIHAHDTREWCVYDLHGRASQIAVGALLETLQISATSEGMQANWSLREGEPEDKPIIDVSLSPSDAGKHGLLAYVRSRSTQRRSFTTKPLTAEQKQVLEAAAGDDYEVRWLERSRERWNLARLLYRSAHIRLTTKEGFKVHSRIVEWGVQYSEDRIPDQAMGADKLVLIIMKWALQSWRRVRILNRFFMGTILPRLQMDLLPGYKCAAQFLIVSKSPVETMPDFIAGGGALQRFWLTSAKLGLQFQPEMTPLIFSRYAMNGDQFSQDQCAIGNAEKVLRDLAEIYGRHNVEKGVFMGRVGFGMTPTSRSIRMPLSQLLKGDG